MAEFPKRILLACLTLLVAACLCLSLLSLASLILIFR